MERDKAYKEWLWSGRSEVAKSIQDAFTAGWEAAIQEFVCNPLAASQEEPWGTLEGAENYLTQQRNIAFLALYRLQDEPFMPKYMKENLQEQAIARCEESGKALDKIRELVKLAQEPQAV